MQHLRHRMPAVPIAPIAFSLFLLVHADYAESREQVAGRGAMGGGNCGMAVSTENEMTLATPG